MRLSSSDQFVSRSVPPRGRPSGPAQELLLTGAIGPRPKYLIRFVDADEEGEPRLIEYVPLTPRRVA